MRKEEENKRVVPDLSMSDTESFIPVKPRRQHNTLNFAKILSSLIRKDKNDMCGKVWHIHKYLHIWHKHENENEKAEQVNP